jgi:glycolate oxidase
MTANHVLAVKAVLPDGEVVRIGGESSASSPQGHPQGEGWDGASLENVGPNWLGLFIGCEGLFGIALEITLRLVARPERYHTILAAYRSLEAAGDAVAQLVASGLPPGAVEMMDRLAMDAAEAAVHAGYPPDAAAALIVELEGPADEVAAEVPRLEALIQESGAFRVDVAHGDEQRAAIWKGRKSAFSAVGRLSPDFIVQDGVVPRTRLGAALAEIEELSERYGLRVANVFHAGDGNLHPLILYDGRRPGELERAEELAGEILRLCIRLGGSITGEHGVGMEKRAYLAEMFEEHDLETMRRIQRAVDPAGIANPGKMLPPALDGLPTGSAASLPSSQSAALAGSPT